MAQVFANQEITAQGLALIASATATNPIIMVGAKSSATVPADPEVASNYTGQVGTITSSSATDNVARIVASFPNASGSSSQLVKAVCFLGRLQSQSDAQAVVFAACWDADSLIYLPPNNAPAQITRFAANVAINGVAPLQVTETGAASLSDLDRLVSCHKAGNPYDGDEQDIYGIKWFRTRLNVADMGGMNSYGITFHCDIHAEDDFKCIGDSGTPFSRIYAYTGYHNTLEAIGEGSDISVYSPFLPYDDNVIDLGQDYARWANFYATSAYLNNAAIAKNTNETFTVGSHTDETRGSVTKPQPAGVLSEINGFLKVYGALSIEDTWTFAGSWGGVSNPGTLSVPNIIGVKKLSAVNGAGGTGTIYGDLVVSGNLVPESTSSYSHPVSSGSLTHPWQYEYTRYLSSEDMLTRDSTTHEVLYRRNIIQSEAGIFPKQSTHTVQRYDPTDEQNPQMMPVSYDPTLGDNVKPWNHVDATTLNTEFLVSRSTNMLYENIFYGSASESQKKAMVNALTRAITLASSLVPNTDWQVGMTKPTIGTVSQRFSTVGAETLYALSIKHSNDGSYGQITGSERHIQLEGSLIPTPWEYADVAYRSQLGSEEYPFGKLWCSQGIEFVLDNPEQTSNYPLIRCQYYTTDPSSGETETLHSYASSRDLMFVDLNQPFGGESNTVDGYKLKFKTLNATVSGMSLTQPSYSLDLRRPSQITDTQTTPEHNTTTMSQVPIGAIIYAMIPLGWANKPSSAEVVPAGSTITVREDHDASSSDQFIWYAAVLHTNNGAQQTVWKETSSTTGSTTNGKEKLPAGKYRTLCRIIRGNGTLSAAPTEPILLQRIS